MDIAEAKEVLAAYLVGQRVGAEALRRALALVNEDELLARSLAEELSGEGADDCQVFGQNLAEFSELSLTECVREMPQLWAHLGHCDECRRAYGEFKPVWRLAAQVKAISQSIGKELTASLCLTLNRAGRLIPSKEDLWAVYLPLSLGLEMGDAHPHQPESGEAPEAEETKRIEWKLRDDEAQCLIHLTVDGLPSGQAAMKCALIADPSSAIEVDLARLELRWAETSTLQLSGLLAQHGHRPIKLAPGSWVVKVQATGGGQSFTWEIPIRLHTAAT